MFIAPGGHLIQLANDTHSAFDQYLRGDVIAPIASLRNTPGLEFLHCYACLAKHESQAKQENSTPRGILYTFSSDKILGSLNINSSHVGLYISLIIIVYDLFIYIFILLISNFNCFFQHQIPIVTHKVRLTANPTPNNIFLATTRPGNKSLIFYR